jgi:hypothetical protein
MHRLTVHHPPLLHQSIGPNASHAAARQFGLLMGLIGRSWAVPNRSAPNISLVAQYTDVFAALRCTAASLALQDDDGPHTNRRCDGVCARARRAGPLTVSMGYASVQYTIVLQTRCTMLHHSPVCCNMRAAMQRSAAHVGQASSGFRGLT